jgi:hypothetical protein
VQLRLTLLHAALAAARVLYRRLMLLMQRSYVPPALETLVVAAAAVVLPQYEPGMTGSLRQQPVVRKALEVARLLNHVEAADGYSPAVAAGGHLHQHCCLKYNQIMCCCTWLLIASIAIPAA